MRAVVTGGAGFIGSWLVDALVDRGDDVVVLDDLSTGRREDMNPAVSFVEGSVTELDVVAPALVNADVVFHLGALRAVQRSVEQPLASHLVNAHGTLVVLEAALAAGVRRVVLASSSSVYGGALVLPTPESAPLAPRSPYAVSKLSGEHLARVAHELHGLETVALRYFNVYGPRQRPDSPYATVIPRLVDALRHERPPRLHGDGLQSRDFTYVDDAVRATLAAAEAPAERCSGRAFNIAAGVEHSLLDVLDVLYRLLHVKVQPQHDASRAGDVRHTLADVTAAAHDLGFRATVDLEEGLARTIAWLVDQTEA